MHYSVLRLRDVRMAVVLTDRSQLAGAHTSALLTRLQYQLRLPVMLVSQSDGSWQGARARAEFDVMPFMRHLMNLGEIDWQEVPEPEEPNLPF